MTLRFEYFPELRDIYRCAQSLTGVGEFSEECWLEYENKKFPIVSFRFGSKNPSVPQVVIIGGVHGLETVGTHVVSAYLRTMIKLLKWDKNLGDLLNGLQLHILPLINPVGMFRRSRSNGNDIDLMRNAPIDADEIKVPLIGGHRLSPKLPWYRGPLGQEMEIESRLLIDYIKKHTFGSSLTLALDVHSGFGLVDRLWFPFAYSKKIFPEAYRIFSLKGLLDNSYPNHIYTIEPQSAHYRAHGDLWDYLYLEHQRLGSPNGVFIPFCLEMGSWHWVRKNPKQVLSPLGIFNPILPHRLKRTQRRHLLLFDFMLKAAFSPQGWLNPYPGKKLETEQKAMGLWYPSLVR